MMYRIEKDSVGELEIPADSYYGSILYAQKSIFQLLIKL